MLIFTSVLAAAGILIIALLLHAIFIGDDTEASRNAEPSLESRITGKVKISECYSQGLRSLKDNFLHYFLTIIILSIMTTLGEFSVDKEQVPATHFIFSGETSAVLFATFINIFIKPVFEYGANLVFVRGNRDNSAEVMDIAAGFNNQKIYLSIIFTNLLVFALVAVGCIALILPGLYIYSRLVLASFLVMDKGLAPVAAVEASWKLTHRYWPGTIALVLLSLPMFIIGLLLLVLGVFPALIWIKTAFASFYQQILDAHDEDFLLSLDIEP